MINENLSTLYGQLDYPANKFFSIMDKAEKKEILSSLTYIYDKTKDKTYLFQNNGRPLSSKRFVKESQEELTNLITTKIIYLQEKLQTFIEEEINSSYPNEEFLDYANLFNEKTREIKRCLEKIDRK